MVLQHKSELHVYRELKWEVGFDEYLELVGGASFRLLLSSVQVCMAFLKSSVGMLKGVGIRNVLISLYIIQFPHTKHFGLSLKAQKDVGGRWNTWTINILAAV